MLFNSTSTGDKSGEGTANLSRESEFTYGFGGIAWVSQFLPLMGSGYPPPLLWYRQTSSTVFEKVKNVCKIHQTSSNCEKSK